MLAEKRAGNSALARTLKGFAPPTADASDRRDGGRLDPSFLTMIFTRAPMIRRCSPLVARASLALAAAACFAAAAFFFIRPSFAPATPPEGGSRLAAQAKLVRQAKQAKLGTSAQPPALARMLPVPGMLALTDGGIVVPLGWPQDQTAERGIPTGFEGQLIVAGRGDALSNCHGWVFTGGRYWIPIESVDTILNDNGY